jgi:methylated-DNA-protein-cysteine methyltransferase related protein
MKPQPSYYDLVFEVTRLIPEGRVTNYGAIADYLHLGSSRMVGWALNQCIKGDNVPAHRVVNRKGELSGRHHFSPPSAMQEALEQEGIKVINDAIVDFDKHFWNPNELDNIL